MPTWKKRLKMRDLNTYIWLLIFQVLCHKVIPSKCNTPPNFVLEDDSIVVRLKEDVAVGFKIFHLTGIDADNDPLSFGVISNPDNVVKVVNVGNNEANVVLAKPLDAESRVNYQVVLSLTDGKLAGNFIRRSLLILVEDINDNPPVFDAYPPSVTLREDDPIGSYVTTLSASDADSGVFGQVSYRLDPNEPDSAMFELSARTGEVRLARGLDYEAGSVHQLKVLASDRGGFGRGGNTATAAVLVKVKDVADQPPEFVDVPSVTRISENVEPFSEVLRLRAIDGDKGVNNRVIYSIISGPSDLFHVDRDSGIVYTQDVQLDRESDRARATNGAFVLGVRARDQDQPSQFADTEVTIMIEDVNDEVPTFKQTGYDGVIWENAQRGTPVDFFGSPSPEVYDYDKGSNGTFTMSIEDDDEGLFEVYPEQGTNEASFSIRVKKEGVLDFETRQEVQLTLVATELGPDGRHSRVPVRIRVQDVNDNSPIFEEDVYVVNVLEDVKSGATVGVVRATDVDSGAFGTGGIRYTALRGPLASRLSLDAITGTVTVSNQTSGTPFDREMSEFHYLTVEARDDLGRGNRNTVELLINVADVNDNPPVFAKALYVFDLEENELDFAAGPAYVSASDPDLNGTANAEVRYGIVDGTAVNNFTIDLVSGRIAPKGTVDYESLPQHGEDFSLTVSAFDLGDPQLSSNVEVLIRVQDKNDHSPKFSRNYYTVEIPENLPPNSEFLKITATDGDGTSPNNKVFYRLKSGSLTDKFVVDPNKGSLTVAKDAVLDDVIGNVVFDVEAVDGGGVGRQLTASATVNVTVLDVNNKPPIILFPNPEEGTAVHVSEGASVGDLVVAVDARDPDTTADLRFSLDAENSSLVGTTVKNIGAGDFFQVGEFSGKVTVAALLDREMFKSARLTVKVEDINSDIKATQIVLAQFTVYVDDVNDNAPVFDQAYYRASILESAPIGTSILRVSAVDPDSQVTAVTFALARGGHEQLDVDKTTGVIYVKDTLDYEVTNKLDVVVVASDNGDPELTNEANVTVNVIDVNDNSPVFITGSEVIEVSEDVLPGTVIGAVTASDLDSGDLGKISYFLDGRSATRGLFAVNQDTGQIIVQSSLDREAQDMHSLVVLAHDNYKFGFTTGDSKSSFAQVTISVSDVNDETPVFETVATDGACSAFITEFHDESDAVLTVRAVDGDDVRTPNGRIDFVIDEGNRDGYFRISSDPSGSGQAKIYPDRPLVGHYGNYTLRVMALDRGQPGNAAFADYNICVQDFNDHAPEFLSPPSNFTIRVPENATVGTEVVRVHAVDTDVGSNGEVKYRIRIDPLGNHKSFAIDPLTGTITVSRTLDRERQRLHELRVEAYDQGVPTSLSSDLDITVYVSDINDNDPQFVIDEFFVNFTEHRRPGVEKALIVGTVDVDDIEGGRDTGQRQTGVCYFIVGGNDTQNTFVLHPTLHELQAVTELDREVHSRYTLVIRATDKCHTFLTSPGLTDLRSNVTFDPADDSLLKVVVDVVDIDDNAPSFSRKTFTGGISTDSGFGDTALTLHAHDPDTNGEVEYEIYEDIKSKGQNLEDVGDPKFIVNKTSGEVLVNFDPLQGMKGHFEFVVTATDPSGHLDATRVKIYLIRQDQRVRFVIRSHPAEIRAKIEDFRSVLANVTGAIVNVDAFEAHGPTDKTKTDVLLHFVHKSDNTVMEVSEVLKIIDLKTEELDPVFREFNVLHTEGARRRSSRLVSSFSGGIQSTETVVILWLAGLCAFLSAILVLVVCLCLRQRSKYLRKLRAATCHTTFPVPSVAASIAGGGRPATVPNTNKHTTEGSNPIWMRSCPVSYDNHISFDHEELDEEDLDDNALRSHQSHLQTAQLDSLDVNVLNVQQQDDHQSLQNQGSTLRARSRSSESSGRGSGTASAGGHFSFGKVDGGGGGGPPARCRNPIYDRTLSIDTMFPPQMPPVEDKLGMEEGQRSASSSARSAGALRRGVTSYEHSVPRTEL